MTQDDSGRQTRVLNIKGRPVVVRQLTDLQMLRMAREAQMLQRANVDNQRKLQAVTLLMELLESAIVQPLDREYLDELTIKGELELSDLMPVISIFMETDKPEKPAVRRGRPRKTPV